MKKLISAVVTVAIFVIILRNVDIQQLKQHFINIDLFYLTLAMLMFIPTTLVTVERWRMMIKKYCKIKRWGATKIFLAAGALNSVTPSKLGDFAKAYFLKKEGKLDLKRGISSILLEKYLDITSICLFSLAGLLIIKKVDALTIPIILFCSSILFASVLFYFFNFSRISFLKRFLKGKVRNLIKDLYEFLRETKSDKKLSVHIVFASLLNWFLQLTQVYFFFLSLNYAVPFELVFALVPAAIIVGLVPVTIGGMGTRDSALIILFSEYAPAELMLGVGLLFSTRYWIPSLIGLPFTKEYLNK